MREEENDKTKKGIKEEGNKRRRIKESRTPVQKDKNIKMIGDNT